MISLSTPFDSYLQCFFVFLYIDGVFSIAFYRSRKSLFMFCWCRRLMLHYIDTHTHTHTYTHTYTHTVFFSLSLFSFLSLTHIHTHAYTHTHTHARAHTHTHTHTGKQGQNSRNHPQAGQTRGRISEKVTPRHRFVLQSRI